MIHIVSQDNLHEFGGFLDALFVGRRSRYVEGTGWDAVPGDDGWDTDKFDHDQAVHLICVGEDASVRASVRLIPSTAPNLISDKLTYLAGFMPPASDDIWVLDRYVSDEADQPASLYLACGVMEFAVEQAISSFVHMGVDESLSARMNQLGWAHNVLGSARSVSVTQIAADYAVLAASRALVGANGSLLRNKPPAIADQSTQSPGHRAANLLIDEIRAFVASEDVGSISVIQGLHAELSRRIHARAR